MSRWIRVQTSIFDHELFAAEPLSEREAWLWLISRAAWKETKHRVGNQMVSVPVGSFFCTLRELQNAWKWKSDTRVRTFLKTLKNEEMIALETNAGKTHITICNYGHYQDAERTDNAQITHEKRTKDTSTPINTSSLRSDVKAQAPAKASVKSELERVLDTDRAQAVVDHRSRLRKPLTAHAAKLLAGKLERCGDVNAAADLMIEKGWQSIEPQWIENITAPRGSSPPGQTGPVMMADLTGALMRQMTDRRDDERDSENRSTIETSYSGGDHGTSAPAFRLTAPEGRR